MNNTQDARQSAQHLEALAPQLKAMVHDAAAADEVVGAQVSVVLGDSRLDLVYGSANLELNIPMTVDTVVQVGSVCKVLTAALIMTLVEEEKLALDTPVIEYFPNFRLSDKNAQETITLRHLLSMSSGMDNGPYDGHGRGEDALERYVASLSEVPHIFPPGQGFGYSSAGTCVAGYLAQRVTGEGWDALMQKRIFDPAGLMHALTLAEELPFHRVAAGHTEPEDGQPAKVSRPWYVNRSMGPAGSTLTISARDLAGFGQIFVNGGKAANGRRVLSEASVRAMMTPTADVPVLASFINSGSKWGLGPSMDHWGDSVVWGHAGGNRSGNSRLVWFPRQRGVLALTLNTLSSKQAFSAKIFGDFSEAVFGARLTAVAEPPKPLENPRRFVGHYLRYGTRIEISEAAGRLRFKEINLGSGKPDALEQLGVTYDSALIPIGGDRFVRETPGSGSIPVLSSHAAVAFSGNDEQGRADIVISDPIFAARRVM